jgi:hypothetical protein
VQLFQICTVDHYGTDWIIKIFPKFKIERKQPQEEILEINLLNFTKEGESTEFLLLTRSSSLIEIHKLMVVKEELELRQKIQYSYSFEFKIPSFINYENIISAIYNNGNIYVTTKNNSKQLLVYQF